MDFYGWGKGISSEYGQGFNVRSKLLRSRQFYSNASQTAVNYEDLMRLKKELMKPYEMQINKTDELAIVPKKLLELNNLKLLSCVSSRSKAEVNGSILFVFKVAFMIYI